MELFEGNIITIYVMAIFCGIEQFSMTQALILGIMVAATWSCVEGELNFSASSAIDFRCSLGVSGLKMGGGSPF